MSGAAAGLSAYATALDVQVAQLEQLDRIADALTGLAEIAPGIAAQLEQLATPLVEVAELKPTPDPWATHEDALTGDPCPSCGGFGGRHGLVHVRHEAGGGGSNLPCPRADA